MSEFISGHYQLRVGYTTSDGSRTVEYLMERADKQEQLDKVISKIKEEMTRYECTDLNIKIKYIDLSGITLDI